MCTGALTVAAVLGLASCEGGPAEPGSSGFASISVSYSVAPGAAGLGGGVEAAFEKVNAIRVVLTRNSDRAVLVDTVLSFDPSGDVIELPGFEVPLKEVSESFSLEVELRRGTDGIFGGSASVTLEVGATREVEVKLESIPAGIKLPDPLPPIQALQETIQLEAAVIFVTGDTIAGLKPTWSSLDPDIVQVSPDGTLVSVGEGEAEVVARFQEFSETLTVQVDPVVTSAVISPAEPILEVGDVLQFSVTLEDVNGNSLRRDVVWTSSDPGVATIDQDGVATAVGVGTTTITGESGAVSDTVTLTVTPPPLEGGGGDPPPEDGGGDDPPPDIEVCEVIDFGGFSHGDEITSVSALGVIFDVASTSSVPGATAKAFDTDFDNAGVDEDLQAPPGPGICADCAGQGAILVIGHIKFLELGDVGEPGTVTFTRADGGEFRVMSFKAFDQESPEGMGGIRLSRDALVADGGTAVTSFAASGSGDGLVVTVVNDDPVPGTNSDIWPFEFTQSGGIDDVEVCIMTPGSP